MNLWGSTLLVLAQAGGFCNYDTAISTGETPTVGQSFWHSAVNPATSGQNANVAFWNDPTTISGTNISRVTATPPTGLAIGNAYELRWSFRGSDGPWASDQTMLRVFSSIGGQSKSPILDLDKSLRVDIFTRQPLRIALLVSESTITKDPGHFEVVSGNLQGIGGEGIHALRASGSFGGWVLQPGWQTLEVDFAKITANRGLLGTGEDGVLNPATPGKVALNGFLFSPIDAEFGLQLRHEVYLDNWRQP